MFVLYRKTRTRTTIYPELFASTTKFTLRQTLLRFAFEPTHPKTDKTTFRAIFRYNTGWRKPVKIDTRPEDGFVHNENTVGSKVRGNTVFYDFLGVNSTSFGVNYYIFEC